MIPIHSLPQEWLWCESWCSDSSKVQAKTIDLCNNPRYKEPKLDMARRVIQGDLFPESWDELDQEIYKTEEEWKQNVPVTPVALPTAYPPTSSTSSSSSSSTTSSSTGKSKGKSKSKKSSSEL